MKSKLLLLSALLLMASSCQNKKRTIEKEESATGECYTNPLLPRGAEPWSIFHEGKYYYTQGAENRVVLWETSDITNLSKATKNRYGYPPTPVIHIIFGHQKSII